MRYDTNFRTCSELLDLPTYHQKTDLRVTADQPIDTTKLNIDFSELGFHTTVYPIYVNGQLELKNFPQKAGIYTLFISYGDEMRFQELAYYRLAPTMERLTFHFFEDSGRLFCRITSLGLHELNKVVLINPVDQDSADVSSRHE